MKLKFILIAVCLGLAAIGQSQTIEIQARGTNLYYSESGCSDCWSTPDPRWNSRLILNSTNYNWNESRDDISGCTWLGISNSSWITPVAAQADDELVFSFDGFEEDEFPCLFFSDDDADCGSYATINTINDLCQNPPYTWNDFEDERTCTGGDIAGTYKIRWEYYWSYDQAPSITQQPDEAVLGGATRTACVGTPITLQTTFTTNDCGGTWARFLQWQSATSPGGPWTDVVGETNASFTPPQTVGTFYYQCLATANETADFTSLVTTSNSVAVTYNPGSDPFCTAPDCDFMYVATFGNDATGDGSPNNPYRTLGYVLNNYATVSASRSHIRMEGKGTPSASDYVESSVVNMVSSVRVEGGFEVSGAVPRTWKKNTTYTTRITFQGLEALGHRLGIKAQSVNNWHIQDLQLITTGVSNTTPAGNGYNNYVIYLNGCNNYSLTRCQVNAGSAADGEGASTSGWQGSSSYNGTPSDPFDGNRGQNGGSGSQGGDANCNWGARPGGSGGNGGSGGSGGIGPGGNGVAGGNGGHGGSGGEDCSCSSTPNTSVLQSGSQRNGARGANGISISGSPGGGSGGNGSTCSSGGCNGSGGSSASDASSAGNGTNGTSNYGGGWFTPVAGTNGSVGTGGSGGGGGGGGAWDNEWTDDSGAGGTGGSGGGGGGGAGKGGGGGGGSFAVFIVNNGTTTEITDCQLTAGSAGNQGLGGDGGPGGTGPNGVSGKDNNCDGDTDGGGAGGSGGNGGAGGDGGNGSTGKQVALLQLNSSFAESTVQAPVLSPSGFVSINTSTSGGAVPSYDNIIINFNRSDLPGRACINSEIDIEKAASSWSLPTGLVYVDENGDGLGSYGDGDDMVKVSTTLSGSYDLGLSTGDYSDFLVVSNVARTLPVINATETSLCEGGSVDFSVTGSFDNPLEREWLVFETDPAAPFLPASSSTSLNVTFTASGTFKVRYRERHQCCGWSKPVFTTIQVWEQPIAQTLTPTPSTASVCAGDPVSADFSAGSGGAGTVTDEYEYSIDGGGSFSPYTVVSGAGADISTTGLEGETIVIRTRRTADGQGCSSSDYTEQLWQVDAVPSIADAGVDIDQCNDPMFSLAAATPVVGNGVWTVVSGGATFMDPTNPTEAITGVPTGNTVLTWAVTNGVCPGSTDNLLLTNEAPPPPADILDIQYSCNGESFQLIGGDPSPSAYLWSVLTGSGSIIVSPTPGVSTLDAMLVGDATDVEYRVSNGPGAICPDNTSSVTVNFLTTLAEPADGSATCTPSPTGGIQTIASADGEKRYVGIDPQDNLLGDVDVDLPGSGAFTTMASIWNGLAEPNGSYGGGDSDPARMPNDNIACPDELFVEFTWEIDVTTQPTGSDPQIVVYLPGTTWDAFVSNGNTWLDATPGLRSSYDGCYNGFPAPSDPMTMANVTVTGYHPTGFRLHPVIDVTYEAGEDYYAVTFNTDEFSGFALHGSGSGTPLPIQLVSFTGEHTAGDNHLEWISATEINASHYVVQRSNDGLTFENLAILEAAGTTAETQTYQYIDYDVPSGGHYYRLDIVDLDGSAEFSNTIWLSSQNDTWAGGFMQVAPNPFSATADVSFVQSQEGVFVLQVTDLLGRPVYQLEDLGQEGLNRIPIDLGTEAAGTYVITVTREDGMTLKQRVVKSTD